MRSAFCRFNRSWQKADLIEIARPGRSARGPLVGRKFPSVREKRMGAAAPVREKRSGLRWETRVLRD